MHKTAWGPTSLCVNSGDLWVMALGDSYSYRLFIHLFETGSHYVAQASFKLKILLLSLLSAGITDLYHYV
jgi:hypothetical protein